MFPIPTIIVSVILAVAYICLRSITVDNSQLLSGNRDRKSIKERQEALAQAGIFLAPYNDIWRDLKLSNTNCSLHLGTNGYTIRGREAKHPFRSFRVIRTRENPGFDLWNSFCYQFSYYTTFDELVRLCNAYNVPISITEGIQNNEQQKNTVINNRETEQVIKVDEIKDLQTPPKIDVNNASEVEITSLPGVSIVMAKKLVKRRDEIGGFKSVDEVCNFLNLKPHMQNQLKNLICINKIKHSGKIKRYNERSIDL